MFEVLFIWGFILLAMMVVKVGIRLYDRHCQMTQSEFDMFTELINRDRKDLKPFDDNNDKNHQDKSDGL